MTRPRAFLRCPHCDTPSVTRTSVMHSKLLRESVQQCRNALCGHTFSAYTEIVRTHTRSASPRCDVDLPISTHAERSALSQKVEEQSSATRKAKR